MQQIDVIETSSRGLNAPKTDEIAVKEKFLKRKTKQELVELLADDEVFRYDKRLKIAVEENANKISTAPAFTNLVANIVAAEATSAYNVLSNKLALGSEEISNWNRRYVEQTMVLGQLQDRLTAMEKSNAYLQRTISKPPAEETSNYLDHYKDLDRRWDDEDLVNYSQSPLEVDEEFDMEVLPEPSPQGEALEGS